DLKADGPPTVFSKVPDQFADYIFNGAGAGTSVVSASHMDFADGEALFSYITITGTGSNAKITDAGVALIKDSGNGTAGPPMPVFQAPKTGEDFATITFVLGVPRTPDTTPPTVKVTAPNGGETAMSGSQLSITFTSR